MTFHNIFITTLLAPKGYFVADAEKNALVSYEL
jgi:hypothetical protein